jgi:hypothetical protein
MPSHAVGLCALCQVPALTAFALAARPARLPADEAAPDIDINSDEEKIVRVQAGTSTARRTERRHHCAGAKLTISSGELNPKPRFQIRYALARSASRAGSRVESGQQTE